MKPLRILSQQDLGEVNAFLGELKDGKLYKERLKALETKKKEINALIETVGKVKEIENLRVRTLHMAEGAEKAGIAAAADRAVAADELAVARTDARKLVDGKRRESNANFMEREKTLVKGETALDMRSKILDEANEDLLARENDLALGMAKAEEIRTQYTEAVVSLKRAIAETSKAL